MSTPTAQTQPRVGTGFRLQWEPVQNCHVLLYPEGMVKLNGSAGEIMKRCDGVKTVATIVAELEAAFVTQGLQSDVLAFVEMAAKQRWLSWEARHDSHHRPAAVAAGRADLPLPAALRVLLQPASTLRRQEPKS